MVPDVVTSKATKSADAHQRDPQRHASTARAKPATTSSSGATTPALGSSTTHARHSRAGRSKSLRDARRTARRHDLLLPPGGRKRKRHQLRHRSREFTTPTAVEGLSTGPVQNLQPDERHADRLALAQRLRRPLLLPVGPDRRLRQHEPRTAGHRRRRRRGSGGGRSSDLERSEQPNTTLPLPPRRPKTASARPSAPTRSSRPPARRGSQTNRRAAIGHEEATINAKVNPDELATHLPLRIRRNDAPMGPKSRSGGEHRLGLDPVAVSAPLSLKLGVTYHFRVVAKTKRGTTTGPDQKFTTIPPAPVDATYATGRERHRSDAAHAGQPAGQRHAPSTSSTAPKAARPAPGACTDIPAPPGEDIGAGEEDVARSVRAQRPDARHHLPLPRARDQLAGHAPKAPSARSRPSSPNGSSRCPTTAPGRWSPRRTRQGAPVEALTREGGLILASEDGNALTYVVDGALGEEVQGNRSPEWQQVLATRGRAAGARRTSPRRAAKRKGVTPPVRRRSTSSSRPTCRVALVEPAGPGRGTAAGARRDAGHDVPAR